MRPRSPIRPIRIEGDVAFVPLIHGYEAIIDAADAHMVAGLNWTAIVTHRPDGSVRSVYALRMDRLQDIPRPVYMHRAIMGDPAFLEVDHIDGNSLNNRRANLRAATRAQNARNQRIRSNNSSGVKGVSWNKQRGKWQAYIRLDGTRRNLGLFACRTAAAVAYAKASAELHGEFGRTA